MSFSCWLLVMAIPNAACALRPTRPFGSAPENVPLAEEKSAIVTASDGYQNHKPIITLVK